MSSNRLETDFYCSECNKNFQSASCLLSHFAFHVRQTINERFEDVKIDQNTSTNDPINIFSSLKSEKKNIPGLYPINMIKIRTDIYENSNYADQENKCNEDGNEQNVNDTGKEVDDFTPLKYCTITMDAKSQKKYPCQFCTKRFGWSTDLKRHILTHTGQRPFKCKYCDATFTRNFLLQKHANKVHRCEIDAELTNNKLKIPNLEPICTKTKAKDSRKQDKQNIKRKTFYVSEMEHEFYGALQTPLNIIDKETIVQ